MKGFILAAGMGSRLKPWTDSHPKALVPVKGVPMLRRVYDRLKSSGIDYLAVNVFHFADQIIDYLNQNDLRIYISDERPALLETGGAILHASDFISGNDSVLIHNADILSNADLKSLELDHAASGADVTLLVSPRESSRKLIFSPSMHLKGWHSFKDDSFRPAGFLPAENDIELAFSGIYIISPSILDVMRADNWNGNFPIMDFLLSSLDKLTILGVNQPDLLLLDIGKPDSLNRADNFVEF